MIVEPKPEKLDLVCEATQEVVKRRSLRVDAMQRLVGSWCWLLLAVRPSLAVLDATYKWLVAHRPEEAADIWDSVRRELMTLVALRPLLNARIDRPWAEHALMTDTSFMGAGVLITRAEVSELRSEAAWVTPKGFFVELDGLDEEEGPGPRPRRSPRRATPRRRR